MRAGTGTGGARLEALSPRPRAGVRPTRPPSPLRWRLRRLDPHIAIFLVRGPLERRLETTSGGTGYLEARFGGPNADRTHILLGNVPATAKQRQ